MTTTRVLRWILGALLLVLAVQHPDAAQAVAGGIADSLLTLTARLADEAPLVLIGLAVLAWAAINRHAPGRRTA